MSPMLDTNVSLRDYFANGKYRITIDGYEYTAITERTYDFQTTSPSRIVQRGFDYTKYSIVQPCVITYTIVVSKLNTTEYDRLLKLSVSMQRFKVTNSVYSVDNCILRSIVVADENFDALILDVTIQEINTSLMFAAEDSSTIFQMFSDINMDGCAVEAPVNEKFELRYNNIPGGNTTITSGSYNTALNLVTEQYKKDNASVELGDGIYVYQNAKEEWVLSQTKKDFLKQLFTTPIWKYEKFSDMYNQIYEEYKAQVASSYQADLEFLESH